MQNLLRLLLILAIAGSGLTFVGSGAAWWYDEERRLRRLVRRSLGGEPDGAIVARGRGAAAGFRLDSGQIVVMRDGGADALLYPLQALVGAELIVDDQVAARAFRDEPRRAPDQIGGAVARVTLRLVFDDPRRPDFDLDLWLAEDQTRRDARSPSNAIEEARRWLARTEAILRRAPLVAVRQPAAHEAEDHQRDPEDDLDDESLP